jgi:hypothetical protein
MTKVGEKEKEQENEEKKEGHTWLSAMCHSSIN